MAFEGLSSKLSSALSKLTSRGKLTEQAVKEGMRDVRMALLEADVNYLVVKDFCKKVTERCVGQQVLDSLRSARGWGIYDLLGGGRCDRRGCRCEGEQKFYGGFHRFLNWFAFLSSAKLAHERPAGTALRKNINDMNCQFSENQLIDASDGVELYK